MDAYRESVARWIRLITITGDGSIPEADQAMLITEVNGLVEFDIRLPIYRWPWQRAMAQEMALVLDAAIADAEDPTDGGSS